LQLEAGAVGSSEDSQRPQLAVNQRLHVVRTDAAPELLGDGLCDLSIAPRAIAAGGHEVQEAWQLEDLPVGSPCGERRIFESGILVLPEQLEALGEARWCGFQCDSSLSRKRGGHECPPLLPMVATGCPALLPG